MGMGMGFGQSGSGQSNNGSYISPYNYGYNKGTAYA
jgi:hypothetical protein